MANPTESKPKVLVVEDNLVVQMGYRFSAAKILGEDVETVQATSLEQGFEQFEQNKGNLIGVVFDYNLGKDETTEPLIQHVKESGFSGPMIASSEEPENRVKQMAAGCTHDAGKKGEALHVLAAALAEAQPPPSPGGKPAPGSGLKHGR